MPKPNRVFARMPKRPMIEVKDWGQRSFANPGGLENTGFFGECNAKDAAEWLRAEGVKGATTRAWKGSNRHRTWTVWVPG